MSEIIPVVPLSGGISSPQELSGNIEEISSLNGNLSVDISKEPYLGPYEVEPRKIEQILETNEKVMTDNVTVNAISYIEVGNLSGGTTATIGFE